MNYRVLPFKHRVPVKPTLQVHVYPLKLSLQRPLFLHGQLAHSSTSANAYTRHGRQECCDGWAATLVTPTVFHVRFRKYQFFIRVTIYSVAINVVCNH